MDMSTYKRALLLGLSMGVVGAVLAAVLSLLGCPKGIAISAGIGVVIASMGTLAIKRPSSH
jgi:hypothetical protein